MRGDFSGQLISPSTTVFGFKYSRKAYAKMGSRPATSIDVKDIDEDLSLSLEIIGPEDWDDTSTLASSFCSISGDITGDDASSQRNVTLISTSVPEPQPDLQLPYPRRIPTPPPLPKHLPVEPYRKSSVAKLNPGYSPSIPPEKRNIHPKWSLHDLDRADFNLARSIRQIFLAREKSRKTHDPLSNQNPGCFLNQALKKQIEDVRNNVHRTEEILDLFRKACALDVEGVVAYLDKGVRPFILGLKLTEAPPINSPPPNGWGDMASWAWRPWGNSLRPNATAELLRLLVAEGMDVDFPRVFGLTPLCAAVEADRVDLIEWLVERGANVNAEGAVQRNLPGGKVGYHLTALDYAVALGKHASTRHLLSLPKVEVMHAFHITYMGITLDLDVSTGRVDATDKRITSAVTAMHFADTYTAPLLLQGRTSLLHNRDSRGRAPFHWAVEDGDVPRTLHFLELGYPVDCPDGHGATALALVCAAHERGLKRAGYPEIVRLLLMRGADSEILYPRDVSIRTRFWMMHDWRAVYEGIFEEFGLLRKCLEEELERMVRWNSLEQAEEGRMMLACGQEKC